MVEYQPFRPFDEPFIVAERVDEPRRRRIGRPLLAWFVIVVMVGVFAARHIVDESKPKGKEPGRKERLSLDALEMQGKYFVGFTAVPNGPNRKKLYEQLEGQFPDDSLESQLCLVVLAGELAGSKVATQRLRNIRADLKSGKQKPRKRLMTALDVLERLYGDYNADRWDAPAVTPAERQQLRKQLGWFGELALLPESGKETEQRELLIEDAQRTAIALMAFVLGGLFFGAIGLIGCIAFPAFVHYGKIRSSIHTGSLFGGVYAETFAAWMLLFIALSLGSTFVVRSSAGAIAAMILTPLLSLAALAWPLVRGVTWSEFRRDIGLTKGNPLLEPIFGIAAYISTLPPLVLALVLITTLMNWLSAGGTGFNPENAPTHPIVDWVGRGGWAERLAIVIVACITAPVVEEIMFRGVLYRHLREWTAGWRIGISVLFSGALGAFIFAVIHPQGLIAVPALMTLALSFSLVREWRGSLIAPMTMHAINNGLITALLFFAL